MSQPAYRPYRQLLTAFLVIALGLTLSACTSTRPYQVSDDERPSAKRILLMPTDVVVLQVGTTGLPLPRERWTQKVQNGFASTARELLSDRGRQLVRYRTDDNAVVPYQREELPAIRMQRAVMQTVLNQRYGDAAPLPDAAPANWTLGTSVAPLRQAYDADLALFLIYRQATSSTGRTVMTLVQTALFGAIQPTSQSVAFASLVDLRTGELVWTNVLQAQGFDTNEPNAINERARELLTEMPL